MAAIFVFIRIVQAHLVVVTLTLHLFMKILPFFAGSFALASLLSSAHAQSLPKVTTKVVNPAGKEATERATADRRAAAYKGPKVVKNTKALGNKMLRDSKPALKPVDPVKQ